MTTNIICKMTANLPINFQIGENMFEINGIDEFGLQELREKGGFDLALMSCRPIVERNRDENIERFKKLLLNEENLLLGIYDVSGGKKAVIGRVSFYDYNSRNLSVELGYLLLEEYQNRGIMSRALQNILLIMFHQCNMNKIYAQTCSLNLKSRKLLENNGFTLDGKLRKHHEYHAILYDDCIYSILKEEYGK